MQKYLAEELVRSLVGGNQPSEGESIIFTSKGWRFGQADLPGLNDLEGILSPAKGGWGMDYSAIEAGSIPYVETQGSIGFLLHPDNSGKVLSWNGTTLEWVTVQSVGAVTSVNGQTGDAVITAAGLGAATTANYLDDFNGVLSEAKGGLGLDNSAAVVGQVPYIIGAGDFGMTGAPSGPNQVLQWTGTFMRWGEIAGTVAADPGAANHPYVSTGSPDGSGKWLNYSIPGASAPYVADDPLFVLALTAANTVSFSKLTASDVGSISRVDADDLYAPMVHQHAASDITSGVLALARGGTGADLSAVAGAALPYLLDGAMVTSPVGAADTYLKSTGTGLTWGTPSGLLPSGTLANAPLLHSGTTGRDGDWANYSLPSVAAPYVAGDPAQVLRLTGANQVSFGALSASDVGALSKEDADTYYRPAGGSIDVADISGTLSTSKGGTGTASLAGAQAVITNPDGSALTTPSGAADGRALLWRSTGPRWEAITGVVGSGTVDHPLLGSGNPGGTYAPYALPHLGAPEAGWVLRSTGSTGTEWHQLTASDVGALPSSYTAPVSSVAGKTGAVTLTAADVGAAPAGYIPDTLYRRSTYSWSAATAPRSMPTGGGGLAYSFVQGADGWPNYGTVLHVNALFGSQDGGAFELYAPYSSAYGGDFLRYRTGVFPNAGWTAWKSIADTAWVGANYRPAGGAIAVADISGTLPTSKGGTGTATLAGGQAVITNPDGSALTTPTGAADGRALLWRSTGPRWEAITGVVGTGTVDHPLLGSGSPGGTYAPYALPHLGAPDVGMVLRSTGSTGTEWHALVAADVGAQPASFYLNRIVAPASYGGVSVTGSTGGFAGIHFPEGANTTFMVSTSDGRSGLFDETAGSWRWMWSGGGELIAGTVPWSRITGEPVYTTRWPTAAEVGALPISGGTLTGYLYMAAGQWIQFQQGAGLYTAQGHYLFPGTVDGWEMHSGRTDLGQLEMAGSDGVAKGYLYFDSTGFGLLHSGGGWAVQILPGGGGGSLTGDWNIGGNFAAHQVTSASNNGAPGIALVRSGGNYPRVGYNIRQTNTTGSYLFNANDYASQVRFDTGGVQFDVTTSPGASGSSIPWIVALEIDRDRTVYAHGAVVVTNTVTATTFYKSSSRALKEDFRPLGFDPSAALDALSPLRFRYRGEAWEDVGFIAEDTDPLFLSPEGLQIDVARVTTVLVADAQATHRRIEALERELAALRGGLN